MHVTMISVFPMNKDVHVGMYFYTESAMAV